MTQTQRPREVEHKKVWTLHLNTSHPHIHPESFCWLPLLWLVLLIVATCCIVPLYTCMWVSVCTCTLLSAKWEDKGGAESLMSSLTGCIHVSLFLATNTCCSGWDETYPTPQSSTHRQKVRKSWEEEEESLLSSIRHIWEVFVLLCLKIRQNVDIFMFLEFQGTSTQRSQKSL